jgi:hypothetical protein
MMDSSRADAEGCPICLERYSKPNNEAEVICKNRHRMCTACLNSLLTAEHSQTMCPECRSPLNITRERLALARIKKFNARIL